MYTLLKHSKNLSLDHLVWYAKQVRLPSFNPELSGQVSFFLLTAVIRNVFQVNSFFPFCQKAIGHLKQSHCHFHICIVPSHMVKVPIEILQQPQLNFEGVRTKLLPNYKWTREKNPQMSLFSQGWVNHGLNPQVTKYLNNINNFLSIAFLLSFIFLFFPNNSNHFIHYFQYFNFNLKYFILVVFS